MWPESTVEFRPIKCLRSIPLLVCSRSTFFAFLAIHEWGRSISTMTICMRSQVIRDELTLFWQIRSHFLAHSRNETLTIQSSHSPSPAWALSPWERLSWAPSVSAGPARWASSRRGGRRTGAQFNWKHFGFTLGLRFGFKFPILSKYSKAYRAFFSRLSQGFEDDHLESFPGRWADTAATCWPDWFNETHNKTSWQMGKKLCRHISESIWN